MLVTKIAIRDSVGYVSLYDYKANREPLYRARLWRNLASVERYLQTDSYRRLAKHTSSDLVIEEIQYTDTGQWSDGYRRKVIRTIRTIPASQVAADAARASTRAERRARGLIH